MSSAAIPHSRTESETTENEDKCTPDGLADVLESVVLQSDHVVEGRKEPAHDVHGARRPRPFVSYTREQALHLSKSPLVKPPDGMPLLKEWFGESNEQNLLSNKKDAEASTPNGTNRDRRYRREAEDGETPSRPAFRSALSQPSQMGNFKHQSLRGSDRDRDRERDTERDLRTLSDKYDREKGRVDRLGLPSNSTILRNRDRDAAPHLAAGTSNRTVSQSQETPTATGTRREQREAGKKKNVESSEDWRRGAEPPRPNREERSEYPRRDRDDRDRQRSRARDTSRQRGSPTSSRRDRERDREDKDKEPPRERRAEREREEFSRRDRDRDRFVEDDDSRRWRDDGKRDERMAQRRDRERWEKERDRNVAPEKDRDRDHPESKADREGWSVEDRDTRSQKRNHRDRRYGNADEGKDRDKEERKEREKEKEPAWMETYVPMTSSSGILGGKGEDGEVDSIQAWKKDMKERELKEKGAVSETKKPPNKEQTHPEEPTQPQAEVQLDEIQIFKLMMKREENKRSSNQEEPLDDRPTPPASTALGVENSIPGLAKVRESRKTSASPSNVDTQRSSTPSATFADPAPDISRDTSGSFQTSKINTVLSTSYETSPAAPPSPITTLGATSQVSSNPDPSLPGLHPGVRASPSASRLPPSKTALSESSPTQDLGHSQPMATGDVLSPAAQFDPPRQSRLLAFGAQNPKPSVQPPVQSWQTDRTSKQSQKTPEPHWSGQQPVEALSNQPNLQHSAIGMNPNSQLPFPGQPEMSRLVINSEINQVPRTNHESLRNSRSYSPFENMSAAPVAAEGSRGLMNHIEMMRSSNMTTDRANFTSPAIETHQQFVDNRGRNPTPPANFQSTNLVSPIDGQPSGMNASNYATGKGSRFAKFFDGKPREPHALSIGRGPSSAGLGSPSALSPRQEPPGFNHASGGSAEARNFSDILAMLNNSAQAQRANQHLSAHGGFNQNLSNMISPQQPQQMHHSQVGPASSGGRHDTMYEVDDSRFVADGMVPGLRPAPAPRIRESNGGGMYSNHLDESMQFNPARLPPQQQRNIEQMYSGPIPPQFAAQGPSGGRNAIPGFQQQPFRGGPSPINNFNPLQVPAQQRLPPGLANLGGRPPHEPAQFIGGAGLGIPSQNLHGGLHANSAQQPFNQFQGASGLGFGSNQPPMRGPPGGINHLGNPLAGSLNGLGGMNNAGVDFRGQNQAQLLSLGGAGGGSGMRGAAFNPQHGVSHLQGGPLLGMRAQQQHLPPPHLMQQMLPPQLQQHGMTSGQHNQNDLMALLMGGAHRE